jgi:ferredoxin
MKVMIVEEECIGCETCVTLCPGLFEMDEDIEKAKVILTEGGSQECIEEAIESCPVSCIHWQE